MPKPNKLGNGRKGTNRFQVSGFGPPWCDMTDSHCALQEIPILSYLPNSYKVRSGPGVSGCEVKNPCMKLPPSKVSISIKLAASEAAGWTET